MTENIKPKFIIESSSDESSVPIQNTPENDVEKIASSSSSSASSSSSSSSESMDSTNDLNSDSNSESLLNKDDLESEFKQLNCNSDNFFSKECNKFILKKEILERNDLSQHEEKNDYLYPNMNDKDFNIKIASKKEFNDTKYDGPDFTKSIKEQSDILANVDFELQPHQSFVKNFMSFQTPYSSLLLYHGLGSGKTCSAIGVCEEMRDYMKQMGINKRIMIIASENVQDNFKLQLFDERKLKQVNGIWSMKGCIGNKLLKEINPMNMPISKEKIISQIKNLINTYYIFLGYVQFANYIIKTMNYEEDMKRKMEKRTIKPGEKRGKNTIELLKDVKVELNSKIIRRLRNEFNNRLIVIDEVHNIRKTGDDENKKVAINLEYLVKSAENMRFLLLSATPMYNNYKEIVWLLNLMNTNDRRGRVDVKDIFDKNGNFKKNGEEVLTRKATGYVSFVRGENPYTFPYRVYPSEFDPKHTFPDIKYPSYQMNLRKIKHEDKKRILSLYLTNIGSCDNCGKCQYCCYKYIIRYLRKKQFTKKMESFGYTDLQLPLESLIISYPVSNLKDALEYLPSENLSDELSPSFDEINNKIEQDSAEDEANEDTIDEENEETLDENDDEENDEENEDEDIITNKPSDKSKPSNVSWNKKNQVIIEYSSSPEDSKDNNENMVATDQTMVPTDQTMVPTQETMVPTDQTMVPTEEEKKEEEKEEEKDTTSKSIEMMNRSHQGQETTGGKNTSSESSSIKDENFSIDPHHLTAKIGLERMMSFYDSKSPPVKGEFEYKPTTLKNYGKIFSRDEIGKYSAKIKCIIEKIYNSENDRVSDGIILIYSQYIDSGLIPMALALEEMGFTRYGQQGIKPLFKNRPTEVVDVRTMKPPEDKKNFMPARYSMITGDPRLSPNNDFEVKGLTGIDNKDGNKVKVVLISKAGSEGIDLKFIRQVHILDPWYNMNRPEQTIGRAVRNFSHKDLPFEKRNVEIYMYGTILDNNIEEAADLYVYRVAEYKAIQIGKVTRILKETAVDCIINHDQTKFTQEIMSANLKEPIRQELSTGEVLDNFKVGDAPFSPSCDYMASCNYDCRPNADIDESKLNEDTYDEHFIVMNSEKILQRIRMLFKESFFYKKDMLLRSIRTPREYPYVQIYSALTQLIEDENEFIVDKYGRNGRLINIGDYYLFQPIELKNKNISIFERSVPLDYKHDMINFELKQNIVKPVIDKRNIDKIVQDKQVLEFPEGKRIVDEMKVNYEIANEFLTQTKVPRGDNNWYKHCGIVMNKMAKEYPESRKYLVQFLVAHLLELLLFDAKLNVMNYLYSLDIIPEDSFERLAKEYFERNSITTKNFTVYTAYKLNKLIILVLEDNIWVDIKSSTSTDEREVASSPETKQFLAFDKKDYNNIVGFIGYEKGNTDFDFKTKNMSSARDTGARCDEAGKAKNMAKLNEIIGEQKYTNETTKVVKNANGQIISDPIGNNQLCVIEEFILRYFNEKKHNNKKWFLTPEMAIYHGLYKIYL